VNFLYIFVGALLILIGFWVGRASASPSKTYVTLKKENI
jgi:hypothetical protein